MREGRESINNPYPISHHNTLIPPMDLSVVVTPEGGIDQSWGKDIKV